MQTDADPSIDETVGSDTSNYLIHLDNWAVISNGVYDVPDDVHPKTKKFATETSKLNSSVNGESSIKSQPT